jgi:uncharacterized membrane protein
MPSVPTDPWSSFTRDPRRPEFAELRASDADRDVVHQLLTEAYADGRLDRDEFDTRTTGVTGARTLGDLPGLLEGLVPTVPVPAGTASLVSPDQLEERAVAKWRAERRSAIGGFVTASVICWVIWSVVMFGGFPWPLFVMLGTGINAVQTHLNRDQIVGKERHKLEKRQRRALEPPPAGTEEGGT